MKIWATAAELTAVGSRSTRPAASSRDRQPRCDGRRPLWSQTSPGSRSSGSGGSAAGWSSPVSPAGRTWDLRMGRDRAGRGREYVLNVKKQCYHFINKLEFYHTQDQTFKCVNLNDVSGFSTIWTEVNLCAVMCWTHQSSLNIFL